ncbi:conserved hypothetical protein [Photobacterium leiognathi lrivu.4.1]|uniref:EAL domain-containing protein n=2 Tax=Photobacterium TaxID=657 RepID=V5ES25_PHOLE|nr:MULTISPECIES: EAL domain-containing protein [Photobacterium]EAS63345.1 hypothetical protein VAS14_16227 [Vibrio angustum S14] [Photobacterium angustum S14]GAD32571.1 conserved hypothetical protein [Photobacterium leiognathi lrivu.4.1]
MIAGTSYLLAFFSASWITLHVAKFFINHDAQQYVARIEHNFKREETFLSNIILPNKCSKQVRHALRKIDYQEPEILFIGLVLDDNTLCTSNGLLSYPITLNSPTLPLIRYELEATDDNEIATLIEGSENTFLLFFNQLRLEDHFHFYCPSCISYHIRLTTEKPPLPDASTWFITKHNFGQANGYIIVSRELKEQLEEQYFYIYFYLYFIVINLIFAIYKSIKKRHNTVESLLKRASKRNQFIPFYQPIFTPQGEVKGAEVLMRWQDKKGEIFTPAMFIHAAEKLKLIDEMTLNMIDIVKHDFSQQSAYSLITTDFFCAFNLTASQIENNEFIDRLIEIFQDHHGFNIEFEITEREQFNDEKTAKYNLNRLQEKGYKIKIDDTGTGYGGFNYFLNFNINGIKIDKMFIDIIGQEDVKINVLDAIIDMAKSLNLTIVAEGIEHQSQVDFLASKEVELLQGYYFSKPIPFDQLNYAITSVQNKKNHQV